MERDLRTGVARRAIASLSRPRHDQPTFLSLTTPSLTTREREVLGLIAAGLANTAIATRLAVSLHTVGEYFSNIFAQLHVASRTEAIVRARDAGLGR